VDQEVPTASPGITVTPTSTPSPTPTATPDDHAHEHGGREQGRGSATSGDRAGRAQRSTGCAVKVKRTKRLRRKSRSTSASTSRRDCSKAQRRIAAGTPRLVRTGPARLSDGRPTRANPAASFATPGAVPIGVPNFFIDKFRIPPFLLPIYQAAGMEYGIRWELLAAINEIETDYGRNLNVSSAGAQGWMQFMPATWRAYGVDANKDGLKDPYNPVDAIFAAARYLRAAGAEQDIAKAVFAYNHADWYVDSVLMRARVIGGLPPNLVSSLTGLTQGRFPIAAKATYAGELERERKTTAKGTNAAYVVESDAARRGIRVFARSGARVVAVSDGRVTKIGRSPRLGRYVQLRDVHGNTYTYARLGSVARTYLAPKPRKVTKAQVRRELRLPRDPAPTRAASGSTKADTRALARRGGPRVARPPAPKAPAALPAATAKKERLFAHPDRPRSRAAGGDDQLALSSYDPAEARRLGLDPKDYEPRVLEPGARVVAGTVLARIGKRTQARASHLLFEIRPAGRGAPRIDPKPILDGWKLLESTAIYRAAGKNPFFGPDAEAPSIGQILLMSKEALERHVLANPRIELYACGRQDVRAGLIDRRVLATLEYLAASGLEPTVSSLQCGHGYYTAGGRVSHHSSGNAVDIAAVNGIPILGHQGRGSITDLTVQRLLTLQGTLEPDQIISLMTFEGAANTYAMADHHDHIHIGWRPLYGTSPKEKQRIDAVLKPRQWIKLIDRLGEIANPRVRVSPSKVALRASHAHEGE